MEFTISYDLISLGKTLISLGYILLHKRKTSILTVMLILRMMILDLYCLFTQKLSTLLPLIIGVLGERGVCVFVWGGERGQNKWNCCWGLSLKIIKWEEGRFPLKEKITFRNKKVTYCYSSLKLKIEIKYVIEKVIRKVLYLLQLRHWKGSQFIPKS